MTDVIRVLSALSAGFSAFVAVLVASPGVGLDPAVIVAATAISAGLAATVALISKPGV